MNKVFLAMDWFFIIANMGCVLLNVLTGYYWLIVFNMFVIGFVSVVMYFTFYHKPKEIAPDEKPTWPPVVRQ